MRRRRRERPPHACAVPGCGATIPGWQRICAACFRKLPFGQRQAIAQAGSAKAPHIVARLCTEAVAWLVAQGAESSVRAAAANARMMGERDG